MSRDLESIEIVKEFKLGLYCHDMRLLYHDLKTWLDRRFQGQSPMFEPAQRIVFYHQDVDYFVDSSADKDNFGFALHNLQTILQSLDISNYFCAVVSHAQNCQDQLVYLQQILTVDDFAIAGITACISYNEPNLFQDFCDRSRVYLTSVEYPFTVLSRRSRVNRSYFMSHVFDKGLDTKGLIAYHNISDFPHASSADHADKAIECPCVFLSTVPWQGNNTALRLKDAHNQTVFSKFVSSIPSFTNFNEDINLSTYDKTYAYDTSHSLQQSLIYVGLESVAIYPTPYISMISFKGIAARRAWILFAPPRQLAYMRQLGFQTFGNFWDEEYDLIPDLEDRVDAIIKILNSISSLSVNDLNQMLQKMQPIIEHNFHHLRNNFDFQEHQKFYQGLQR